MLSGTPRITGNSGTPGSMTVGDPIILGTPNSVLIEDNSGNLNVSTPSVPNTFLEWNGTNFVWVPGVAGTIAIGDTVTGGTSPGILYQTAPNILANNATQFSFDPLLLAHIQISDFVSFNSDFSITPSSAGLLTNNFNTGVVNILSLDNVRGFNLTGTLGLTASGIHGDSTQAIVTSTDGVNTAKTTWNPTSIEESTQLYTVIDDIGNPLMSLSSNGNANGYWFYGDGTQTKSVFSNGTIDSEFFANNHGAKMTTTDGTALISSNADLTSQSLTGTFDDGAGIVATDVLSIVNNLNSWTNGDVLDKITMDASGIVMERTQPSLGNDSLLQLTNANIISQYTAANGRVSSLTLKNSQTILGHSDPTTNIDNTLTLGANFTEHQLINTISGANTDIIFHTTDYNVSVSDGTGNSTVLTLDQSDISLGLNNTTGANLTINNNALYNYFNDSTTEGTIGITSDITNFPATTNCIALTNTQVLLQHSSTITISPNATSVVFDGNGNIRASAVHNNATAQGSASQQDIRSGTYTPTLTNVTNITASTAYQCQWMRVGNVVTVSGKVDIDDTLAVATELGISLPVPSNLGTAENLAGTASCSSTAGLSAAISADATNDRASLKYIAVSLTNDSYFFSFSYLVI